MQNLWNIWTHNKCSRGWDTSGLSSCGLCGHVHMGVGLGLGLRCLHNSYSGPRCTTTAVLGPDFSGSVLVTWGKCLRDTRADCQNTHGWDGAKDSANNSGLCEPTLEVTGDTTKHAHRWTAPAQEYSVTPLPVGAPQSHLPCTADQKCSSETDLGVSTRTTKKQTLTLTGQWQPQSKEEVLLNIQFRFWSPQHQLYLLSRLWSPQLQLHLLSRG